MSEYIYNLLTRQKNHLTAEIEWATEDFTSAKEGVRLAEIKLSSLRSALEEVEKELARWNT